MSPLYPAIVTRYLSTFLDSMLMLGVFIALSFLFPQDTPFDNTVRIVAFVAVFLCYEPFCVSFFCTLGQKVTGIRVLSVSTFERIPFPFAFVRYILKITLGFVSLFAIVFSKNRRAIHDFASGSIVVRAGDQKPERYVNDLQNAVSTKNDRSLAHKVWAGCFIVLAGLFGLMFWGWSIFVDQAIVAINKNPIAYQYIGEVQDIDSELIATSQEENPNVFIFRVKGTKGSGVIRAEFMTHDAYTEDIVSGSLRLDSGETFSLVP